MRRGAEDLLYRDLDLRRGTGCWGEDSISQTFSVRRGGLACLRAVVAGTWTAAGDWGFAGLGTP